MGKPIRQILFSLLIFCSSYSLSHAKDDSSPGRFVSDKSFWVFQFNVEKLQAYDELKLLKSNLKESEEMFSGVFPLSSLKKVVIQVGGEKLDKVEQSCAISFVFNQKLDQSALIESARESGTICKKTLEGKEYWESDTKPTPIVMFPDPHVLTMTSHEMLEPLMNLEKEKGHMERLLAQTKTRSDVVFAFRKGAVTDEVYDFLAALYSWGKGKQENNPFLTLKNVREGVAEIDFSSDVPVRFFALADSNENALKIRKVYREGIPSWQEFAQSEKKDLQKQLKSIQDPAQKNSKENGILFYQALINLLESPSTSVKENRVDVEFKANSGKTELLIWTRNKLFPNLIPVEDVVGPASVLEEK